MCSITGTQMHSHARKKLYENEQRRRGFQKLQNEWKHKCVHKIENWARKRTKQIQWCKRWRTKNVCIFWNAAMSDACAARFGLIVCIIWLENKKNKEGIIMTTELTTLTEKPLKKLISMEHAAEFISVQC